MGAYIEVQAISGYVVPKQIFGRCQFLGYITDRYSLDKKAIALKRRVGWRQRNPSSLMIRMVRYISLTHPTSSAITLCF